MNWRNAGGRTRLGPFDASVLLPLLLCLFAFHWITISLLVLYAAVNGYLGFKGKSMGLYQRRFRFWLRGGVVLARPRAYWRKLLG
jgi:hypothetical protein